MLLTIGSVLFGIGLIILIIVTITKGTMRHDIELVLFLTALIGIMCYETIGDSYMVTPGDVKKHRVHMGVRPGVYDRDKFFELRDLSKDVEVINSEEVK